MLLNADWSIREEQKQQGKKLCLPLHSYALQTVTKQGHASEKEKKPKHMCFLYRRAVHSKNNVKCICASHQSKTMHTQTNLLQKRRARAQQTGGRSAHPATALKLTLASSGKRHFFGYRFWPVSDKMRTKTHAARNSARLLQILTCVLPFKHYLRSTRYTTVMFAVPTLYSIVLRSYKYVVHSTKKKIGSLRKNLVSNMYSAFPLSFLSLITVST